MMLNSKMKSRKRLSLLTVSFVSVLLLLVTAGCMGDPTSETIIIPEEEQPASGVSVGEAFKVNTIYPLPASASSEMQVLGWTSGESVVGYFSDNASADSSPSGLQLLAPPYEQPKLLANASNLDKSLLGLSPDGKLIAGLTASPNSPSLVIMPVVGNHNKPIAVPIVKQRLLLSRHILWSNNSRYISYLVAGDSRAQLGIVVCDAMDGTAKELPLQGYSNTDGDTSVLLSDDGSGVLIDDGKLVTMAKRKGDGGFEVKYDHPSGTGGSSWIDADRFVFLGTDGTLFQYDNRNGELSVLLEKVGSFSLSPDRKVIAYTHNDAEAIYAGKLQGNNVLYQTAIYQGIVPFQMSWSLSNNALLVDGNHQSTRAAQIAPAPVAAEEKLQTFVIKF